jgi:hypothetical protein
MIKNPAKLGLAGVLTSTMSILPAELRRIILSLLGSATASAQSPLLVSCT